MTLRWAPRGRRHISPAVALAVLAAFCAFGSFGCKGSVTATTNDPAEKLRLEILAELYRDYVNQHRRGPPNEQAFKDHIRKLPKEQKDQLKIGDDVDTLFVSPRDQQKYVIRYNLALSVEGETRAIAWEHTGKDGKRFVALSMGYVEEKDEDEFKQLTK